MSRILVTGSRDWTDPFVIGEALIEARDDLSATADEPPTRMVLVSGACPAGADSIAEDYAERWRWVIERHPADWDTHDKRAGFVRNAEMVKLGADVCLAFIGPCRKHPDQKHGSHGATHTADLAERAGIETRRFYA